MHIHVLPFGTTFLQRSANASLGGASQSAATRCAGSVATCLRHSQLGAAYAALGLDDRPTQRVAALRSGAGA